MRWWKSLPLPRKSTRGGWNEAHPVLPESHPHRPLPQPLLHPVVAGEDHEEGQQMMEDVGLWLTGGFIFGFIVGHWLGRKEKMLM